jgi:hypothetical protein
MMEIGGPLVQRSQRQIEVSRAGAGFREVGRHVTRIPSQTPTIAPESFECQRNLGKETKTTGVRKNGSLSTIEQEKVSMAQNLFNM